MDRLDNIALEDLTFAVVNTAPSSSRGEHWCVITLYAPDIEVKQLHSTLIY